MAVDGVVEALDGIRLPHCVASSGTHAKMQRTLGQTGLLQRFEGRIFSATEVANGKPAPDLTGGPRRRKFPTFDVGARCVGRMSR